VSPGPLALVGSGEYLPVMAEVDALLLADRPPRYVQIPTAAAPEGEASLQRWVDLGVAQAARLGVEPVPVVVKNRTDADHADLAQLIAGAGLIYLSGGNPTYLAQTMRGTLVWEAVMRTWRGGAALAGCSAGAMAMTGWVPQLRALHRDPDPGLGLLPHLRVIPHFDRMLGWAPDLLTRAIMHPPTGTHLLGIDEDTAAVDLSGQGLRWQVHGRQQVWEIADGPRRGHAAGDTIVTESRPSA
jgi:cyanophycinase